MTKSLIPTERVTNAMLVLHGHKVLLDADLAVLYGVSTKVLNQAVRRNRERFPADFMFQLTRRETSILRSQSVTSSHHGGRRHHPFAFTEQGVAMLSSVVRSPRAIAVNIEIMRAFVRLRRLLASNANLARKLAALEMKYDGQFATVFQAVGQLMAPRRLKRKIGFKKPS
jgi:hypothetical protein